MARSHTFPSRSSGGTISLPGPGTAAPTDGAPAGPEPERVADAGSGASGRQPDGRRSKVLDAADLFWLLMVITAVMIAGGLLIDEDGALLGLKLFSVFVLAFVPGWLYLRFARHRTSAVFLEYVLNLHRLRVDEPEYLPLPPVDSIYYSKVKDDPPAPRRNTLYHQKFEAYYGSGTANDAWPTGETQPGVGGGTGEATRIVSSTLLPALIATAVFAVGWAALLFPARGFPGDDVDQLDAVRFAFMGAYLFSLQMLVRRYFQADLRPSAYLSAVVRVVSSTVIAFVVVAALDSDEYLTNDGQRIALAFLVGFFPLLGLQALQKVAAFAIRKATPLLRNDNYPLSDLDGLNVWYEVRLMEEGIEDMQSLTTANLVDVILHTRVPVGRLVDWIDQAFLYVHLEAPKAELERWETWVKRRRKGGRAYEDPGESSHPEDWNPWRPPLTSREKLRRLGIRCATDLEDACHLRAYVTAESEYVSAEDEVELQAKLRCVLNTGLQPEPSAVNVILKSLENEPNMKAVRRWRVDWERTCEEEKKKETAPDAVRPERRPGTGRRRS